MTPLEQPARTPGARGAGACANRDRQIDPRTAGGALTFATGPLVHGERVGSCIPGILLGRRSVPGPLLLDRVIMPSRGAFGSDGTTGSDSILWGRSKPQGALLDREVSARLVRKSSRWGPTVRRGAVRASPLACVASPQRNRA